MKITQDESETYLTKYIRLIILLERTNGPHRIDNKLVRRYTNLR